MHKTRQEQSTRGDKFRGLVSAWAVPENPPVLRPPYRKFLSISDTWLTVIRALQRYVPACVDQNNTTSGDSTVIIRHNTI